MSLVVGCCGSASWNHGASNCRLYDLDHWLECWLEFIKRASVYIDKILKGAKAADLAIEQPTKFDFVINLKTAKALGLTLPQSLRLQAELIE